MIETKDPVYSMAPITHQTASFSLLFLCRNFSEGKEKGGEENEASVDVQQAVRDEEKRVQVLLLLWVFESLWRKRERSGIVFFIEDKIT